MFIYTCYMIPLLGTGRGANVYNVIDYKTMVVKEHEKCVELFMM